MSSAVYIQLKEAVLLPEWEEFCRKESIEYHPYVVGGSTYYYGGEAGVQIQFGHGPVKIGMIPPFSPPASAQEITVSTFWMGPRLEHVAEVAKKVLGRFPGSYESDPELKRMMKEAHAQF